MRLTKERAKKPLLSTPHLGAACRFSSASGQWEYVVTCHGPWVQGKGHESSYTLHLTKAEMLYTVNEWLSSLARDEREQERRRALPSGDR